MGMLTVVVVMLAVMVVLLVAAIIADRTLQRRMSQRRALQETPGDSPRKKDAADALIDMLNRSGDIVREAVEASREGQK